MFCKNLQKKYLVKPRILPQHPKNMKNIDDIVKYYTNSGSFNGGRLAEACHLYEAMLENNTTIALTIAGALTPTGLGGFIISLIENGFIDFIISTGANLYHDIHFALGLPVYQGDFRVDDRELYKAGIERIYDIFITEELLQATDKFLQDIFIEFTDEKIVSSSELHNIIGKKILAETEHPEFSLLGMSAKYNVPIYTPSPGDSSIGMNLAASYLNGCGLRIDPSLDVIETTAIVYGSEKNGVIILGGGSPKNFYLQTQPTLWQILNINKGGHDYFIQITTDSPQWGGLSGATPSEAISWGKIKPDKIKNHVVVYSDVTIAAPLLFSYILNSKERKKRKELYKKRDFLVESLKNDYSKTL